MESTTSGLSRYAAAALAAPAAACSVSSCRSSGDGTSFSNPNFFPHFAKGPPPGFPPQASFGALKLFADAAFKLQNQKGGACPLAHEMLQLVDPPEPCLICLTALHAKSKTIITVSDGVCWCRVASTQLPPVASALSGCSPDEEQLNVAAIGLAGSLLRLSQLSITRTPRGKHIILCRAFHVLSRECKVIARALQAQQRPEVMFPMWTEGSSTSFTQSARQPLQQQHPGARRQQTSPQEAPREREQSAFPLPHTSHAQLPHTQQQNPRTFLPQQQETEPPHDTAQPGGLSQHSGAPGYSQQQQHPLGQQQRNAGGSMYEQSHVVHQQQASHEQRPQQRAAQQPRQGPYSQEQDAEAQQHQLQRPPYLSQPQQKPPQQQAEQQRLPQQQHHQQVHQQGEKSATSAGSQRQHSPQRYHRWNDSAHQERFSKDERPQSRDTQQSQLRATSLERPSAPCSRQEHQQQLRQLQSHEATDCAHVDHLEGPLAGGTGPQRQPAVLPTYRSAPYPSCRPQVQQQQRAQHGVRTSIGGEAFIPINDLTAYVAKWTIRARVDVKGDIRKYNNARGPGQLFNVELKDKSGEIRATFFNAAVDRWFNVLQEGKVYYFRGGAVKAKNPRFNSTRHNYEITFDEKSSIIETQDEGDIPSLSSEVVDIKKIDAMDEVNATISVTAIVHDYRPIQSITIKATGQPKPKRDVFLVDDTGLSICLTLWGDKAKEISEDQLSQRPVVFFRNVRVGDWNGKKLDSQTSTRIEIHPNNGRAAALQDWWKREGSTQSTFQTVSSSSGSALGRKEVLKTLEQMGREAVHVDPSVIAEKGIYFSCATLLERVSDERFSWPACPECRKKMVETVAHIWSCANCGRQFDQPNHTYMLNMMLMDVSGSLRCTCMGEKAEEIMGFVKAETLLLLQDHQSLDEQGRSFNDVFADVNLEEWIFRICSKNDTYMDEMRLKHRVVAATPLFRRVADQTRHRLDFIRTTLAQVDSLRL